MGLSKTSPDWRFSKCAIETKISRPAAEHVVAIAVKLGRLKDLARVQAFLEQGAVDMAALRDVLHRHNLMTNWLSFCAKAGIEDPFSQHKFEL